MVQCLRLRVSTAGSMGSILGPGTKILHARWYSQKKKKMGKVRKELIEMGIKGLEKIVLNTLFPQSLLLPRVQ